MQGSRLNTRALIEEEELKELRKAMQDNPMLLPLVDDFY